MSNFIFTNQFYNDDKGRTLPKARLHFYDNNTFNFTDVYSDPELTQVLDNPVTADGAGRFPQIFMDISKTYRVWLKDRNDVQVTPYIDDYSLSASISDLGTAAFSDLTTPSATIWDDGNLKVNTFDCNAAGDFLFPNFGYANSATSISIILPLNMISTPSGFTMTDGVTAYTLGAGIITGGTKTGADMTLSVVSTSRCAAISFSGYTGLTVGSQYIFRTSAATSKLEFS